MTRRAPSHLRPGKFKAGDRVEVILTGVTGTVIKAPATLHAQHHFGVRVAWDERPYAFSPESSVVACPTNNLRKLP